MKKRLEYTLAAVLMIVIGGSLGYYLIFKGAYSFVDCLYMTVISLTTVGYGEVVAVTGNIPAQVFTMILITFGMGVILYGISSLTALIVEGELSGLLRKKKMKKAIEKLSGHYIVCGGGETGQALVLEMAKNGDSVVVIESDEKNVEQCSGMEGVWCIQGDATEDKNLVAAGIERAAGVLISLPSDKDNLYITMTARILNKQARIVCRMIKEQIRAKLMRAGADQVVASSTIGALRMASVMIRPHAVDFLDSMLRSSQGNLRIHQLSITEKFARPDVNVGNSGIKEEFDLLILGVKEPGGEIIFNPPPGQHLAAGATLIVMGEMESIIRARERL